MATSVTDRVKAYFLDFVDYKLIMRGYDKGYLLTKEDKDQNFPGNRDFDVMYNPLSFPVSETENIKTCRENVVIAVGRLVPQKNFSSLLRIWKHVTEVVDGWTLKIVGMGSDYMYLQKLTAELNIEDSVVFTGLSYDVLSELRRAKIGVCTSKYEGFCLSIIEEMSCKLPVVSYALPYGPKDILTDGKDGFLVEMNDEETFAQRLLSLIGDENLRQRMGRAAEKRSGDFSCDTIMKKWMQEYESLIREKLK